MGEATQQQPNFATCALNSGLVTEQDLEEARRLLELKAAGAEDSVRPVSDEDLASQIIQLGRLNRWQADQLLAGRSDFHLGPYFLTDSLGYGGMGQVFKAEHTIMGREVAIKVLPRHRSTPEAIEHFLREVRTQAQLDHENLVRAHDAGHDKHVWFLVTEFVPGADLRKLVRREGPLSMSAAASIMVQVSRGLEYAHRRSLIHRDIKPGNVLVMPDGRAKLSDLGLASFFVEGQLIDTRKNKVVGTSDYIAPEQTTRPGYANVQSDIYSLGCTLYYAITSKVPFPGGTYKEKWLAHRSQEPIDPRRLNPNISREFCKLIEYMMAKDPSKRPQSAAEVGTLCAAWVDAESPLVAHSAARPSLASTGGSDGLSPSPGNETNESSDAPHSQRTRGLSQPDEETVTTLPDEAFPLPLSLQALIITGGIAILLGLAWLIAIGVKERFL